MAGRKRKSAPDADLMDTTADAEEEQTEAAEKAAQLSRANAAGAVNLGSLLTQTRTQVATQSGLYSDPSAHRQDHFSGAIKQIHVRNFMTYSETTWTPGMGLNVICGPNGSGKSSMSSAICIGLNGKAQLTGRETKNARYIKNGTHDCEITVTLYGNTKHKQWRVRRTLTREADGDPNVARSKFHIQKNSEPYKTATGPQVNELTASLGIDFTNLCQYLPQERVSEFSHQSPQELLENTEKALDGKLFDTHQRLKDYGRNMMDTDKLLITKEHDMTQLKEQCRGMAKDVGLAREHTMMQKKQARLTNAQKILYLRDSLAKLKGLTQDHADKKDEYKKAEKIKLKIDEKYSSSNKEILKINDKKIQKHYTAIQKHVDTIDDKERDLKGLFTKIRSKKQTFLRKKEEDEKRDQVIVQQRAQMAEYEGTYNATSESIYKSMNPTEEEEKKWLARRKDGIDACEKGIILSQKRVDGFEASVGPLINERNKTQRQVTRQQSEIEEIKSEEKTASNKMARARKVEENRIQQLKQDPKFRSAFAFREVLNQHKAEFAGNWIGPLAAYVESENPQICSVVENFVGQNDVEAFLFEKDEDRQRAIDLSGHGKKHSVNLLTLKVNARPLTSEQAKALGFNGILDDVVKMNPLMRAHYVYQLCYPFYIDKSNKNGAIPDTFDDDKLFRANATVCYFMLGSAIFMRSIQRALFYEGTTSNTVGVRDSTYIKASNKSEINRIITQAKQDIEMCQLKREEVHGKIKELHSAADALKEEIENIRADAQVEKKRLNELTTWQSKLKEKRQELARLEKRTFNLEEMKEEIRLAVVDYARSCSKHLAVINGKDGLYNKIAKSRLDESHRMKDAGFELIKCEKKEEERRVATENYERAREAFEKLDGELQPLKDDVKEMQHDLSRRFNVGIKKIRERIDIEIAWLTESDLLSYEKIDAMRMQLAGDLRRADLVDPRIIQEYTNLMKKVELLSEKIQQITENRNKLEQENRAQRDAWLGTMKELIEDQISDKFGGYFQKFGCQGTVEFGPVPKDLSSVTYATRADVAYHDDEDFKNYGVLIWVQFRPESPMKLNNCGIQSGGEQSLTTMLFLLAMQPKSKTPFRLIDEINQGMDNRNERLIFQALVDTSAESKTQYFIITPKLLRNLPYSEKMTLHIVHNGLMCHAENGGRARPDRPIDMHRCVDVYTQRATQDVN